MTGFLRAMGRRSPALLLLLLLLVGGGGASGSTPHAVMTLDWTLAPAKKYLVDYLIKLNPFDACDEGKKDEIAKGFINFTRLYHSEDYPRDDAKGYTGMPLMLYASVLLFVIFVLVFIFWCLFRCCCRCCKCCNPVLYAPPEKRKRKECCCCFCYTFALLLFLATTALFIASALLAPKSVKSVDTDVLDPVEKYITLLPKRLRKVGVVDDQNRNQLNKLVTGFVSTIFNRDTFDLDSMAASVGKYLDVRLDPFLDYLAGAVGVLKSADYTATKEASTNFKGGADSYEEDSFTDLDIDDGDTSKYVGQVLQGVSGSMEDFLEEFDTSKITAAVTGSKNWTEENNPCLGQEGTGFINADCLAYKVMSCLVKERNEMEACFSGGMVDALDLDQIGEELQGPMDEAIDGIDLNEIATDLESNLEDIKKYIRYARLALNGKLDELLEEFDIDNDAISKYTNIASKVFPHMLLITCGVFALFMILYFIWPVSCALCLRKRNRAKGKCACKAWIKCTITLCGTPFVLALLILSILGLFSAVSYYIVMAEVFSTDESTFGEEDGTPAPIGEEFSKCAMNDYLKKESLIKKLLDGDDDETGGDSFGGRQNHAKRALRALATRAEGDSDSDNDFKDDLIDYALDHIGSLLSCSKVSEKKIDDDATVACEEGDECDRDYINKYGNFLTAIGLHESLGDFVEEFITLDTVKELLCEDSDSDDCGNDPLLSKIDNVFVGNGESGTVYHDLKEAINSAKVIPDTIPKFKAEIGDTEVEFDPEIFPLEDDFIAYYTVASSGAEQPETDKLKEVKCKVPIVAGISLLLENASSDLSGQLDDDMSALSGMCYEGNELKVEEEHSLLTHSSFHDLMAALGQKLASVGEDSSEALTALKGKVDAYLSLSGKMQSALSGPRTQYIKFIAGLNGMLASFRELKGEFDAATEQGPGALGTLDLGSSNLTQSIVNTVADSCKSLEGVIEKFDGNNFLEANLYGLLSCYPIGILKEKGVEMTNTYSHYFTMDHIAVLLMTVAVIVMMIAANCGPIVYHERYTRKCCCCCHTKRKAVKAPARTYAHAPAPAPVQGNVVQPAVIEIRVQGAAPGGPVIRTAAPGGATSDVEMYRSTYDSGHGRRYEGSADPYGQYGANEIYSSRPVYSDRESSYMGAPRRR